MKQKIEIDFHHFLESFPNVELPVTLDSDASRLFSRENKPLTIPMVLEYIPNTMIADEFTEYVACFQLEETVHYYAIVYWKAMLMNYEYVLVTYDKAGERIDAKMIGWTVSKDNMLLEGEGTVDENNTIYIVSNSTNLDTNKKDKPKPITLKIEESGEIIEFD